MKKIINFLIPIIISISIAIIVTFMINTTLDRKLSSLIKEKDVSLIGNKYGDTVKDKSALDKTLLSNEGTLFLLGSSEMGVQVPQNSINMFPFKGAEYRISCFGRAYSQDLQQASYLGSGNIKEKQKVTLLLSAQWFEDKDAIEPANFSVNFSDTEFYKFLNNPKISEENKQYYCERIYTMLNKAKKYPAEAFYARLYCKPTILKKSVKLIFEPYYKIKEYLLDTQDKALLYEEIKDLPSKSDKQELKEIDWSNEYEKIKQNDNKSTFTNEFHLDDKYYKSHLMDLAKTKGISKDENPAQSKEIDDYKFLLSVCKELNIEPYVILLPVNGWYYDYVELPKDKRDKYYDKVKKIAEDNKVEVLDLQQYEYKEGFLMDPKHLGEEGWLKVSEEIYKHFNK